MAMITIDRVWITDPTTPEDYITCFTAEPNLNEDDGVMVDVRLYAAGRVRAVTRDGSSRTVAGTLVELSKADVAWLRLRRGRLVCLRDRTGRKIWGTYAAIRPVEYKDMSAFSVDLSIQQLSHDESV